MGIGDAMAKPTAYTIGRKSSYDEALASQTVVTKLGRDDPRAKEPHYGGGCVWRTREEGQRHIDADAALSDYAVYGLVLPTSWEVDVDESAAAEEGFARLLHGAMIVAVDEGA